MVLDIDECLRTLVHSEGSDLHLKVASPPMARINGDLRPLEGYEKLSSEETEAALRKLLTDDRTREEFASDGEADFAYALKGVSRFRVNAFRQRGSVSIVCRAIPFQVRTIEDLGLPPVIRDLADEKRGIILLTGTTGSGKSTTLAAMIDHINNNNSQHIITLEDPIEYLHRDKRSIVNQREVGSDTISFGRAMRRVLRQDPDVILVGEMRDEETVRIALSAAETGHLVLSTLHTLDATETINRIIDFFPPHLQQQARVMLASTLRGAVSQRLVPTKDGTGRVAASEILVVTGRVQDLILNPNETGKISQVIAEGEYYGMRTFDQALLEKVAAGQVDEQVAMDYASSPHDFKLMLASAGKAASDLSQLDDDSDEAAPEMDIDGAYGSSEPAPEPAPEPVAPAPPLPPAAPAPQAASGPAEISGANDVHVDYGSPEHAYGRSVESSEPDPNPQPPAVTAIEPEPQPPAVTEPQSEPPAVTAIEPEPQPPAVTEPQSEPPAVTAIEPEPQPPAVTEPQSEPPAVTATEPEPQPPAVTAIEREPRPPAVPEPERRPSAVPEPEPTAIASPASNGSSPAAGGGERRPAAAPDGLGGEAYAEVWGEHREGSGDARPEEAQPARDVKDRLAEFRPANYRPPR